jgi:hypothetical protein
VNDEVRHFTLAELEAGLDEIRAAPREAGAVEMIVRRPTSGAREVLASARLEPLVGLVGDRFGAANPLRGEPLTLMSSRAVALIAGNRSRWPLAGDQLYVDFDLSGANLPPGTRLAVGGALIEVSAEPHTGCRKFRERYGIDAVRFVGSSVGKELQLRGINAHVVSAGDVRVGDIVRKI